MGPSSIPDNNFYLYLWRSPDSPGTLYLAKGFGTAEALCRGLTEDGYIVKVIHTATDTEFELSRRKTLPRRAKLVPRPLQPRPSQRRNESGFRLVAESRRLPRSLQDEDLATNASGSGCALP